MARMCSGRLFSAVGAAGRRGEAELGGDHDLVADRGERLADEGLVGERPVDLGGVEERDAEVDRFADDVDAVLFGNVEAVGVAQAHAAEADGGDVEAAGAEGATTHGFLLETVG